MADQPPESEAPESPNVRTIRQLVRLMHKFDLSAIDLVDDTAKIRLRRGGPPAAPAAAPMPAPASAMPAPTAGPSPAPASAPAPDDSTSTYIKSPMVGTFYASPSPDSPPFVTPGASVRPESTVCVIEAMKVYTDIDAGVAGTIAEILVKNGQSVEFDEPLFRVTPA